MSSLPDLITQGVAECGLDVRPRQVESLVALAEMVGSWASRINLTGHREPEQVVRRLILDAAALLAALPQGRGEKARASLADLGAGAGFPGLPIAVLAPGLQVVLVESRLRRHHFQRAAVRELGLENVEVVRGRIEEVEPRACSIALAQAVAQPERVLGWMLPWAEPGGWLVIPGGESAPDPLAGRPAQAGIELPARIERYEVPLGGPTRSFWAAERSA